MGLHVNVYLNGQKGDPTSLENGHVLRVTACIGGVISIANQVTSPAGKIETIKNCLSSEFGSGSVSSTPAPDPYIYKYVWIEGEGWTRICCYVGGALVKFDATTSVAVEIEIGSPYLDSST